MWCLVESARRLLNTDAGRAPRPSMPTSLPLAQLHPRSADMWSAGTQAEAVRDGACELRQNVFRWHPAPRRPACRPVRRAQRTTFSNVEGAGKLGGWRPSAGSAGVYTQSLRSRGSNAGKGKVSWPRRTSNEAQESDRAAGGICGTIQARPRLTQHATPHLLARLAYHSHTARRSRLQRLDGAGGNAVLASL